MIFVTVGTQLPFDRLIDTVDNWCSQSSVKVFAQIGPSSKSYQNVTHKPFLEPIEFDQYFNDADLIIAHAGMGSILTALTYGKPLIIMPRKASLGEHRNDHQIGTARQFSSRPGITVAWNETQLVDLLTNSTAPLDNNKRQSIYAGEPFISNLKKLINN